VVAFVRVTGAVDTRGPDDAVIPSSTESRIALPRPTSPAATSPRPSVPLRSATSTPLWPSAASRTIRGGLDLHRLRVGCGERLDLRRFGLGGPDGLGDELPLARLRLALREFGARRSRRAGRRPARAVPPSRPARGPPETGGPPAPRPSGGSARPACAATPASPPRWPAPRAGAPRCAGLSAVVRLSFPSPVDRIRTESIVVPAPGRCAARVIPSSLGVQCGRWSCRGLRGAGLGAVVTASRP